MHSGTDTLAPFLMCTTGARRCGFPLAQVMETMRPLPVETFPGMLPCMDGMAIIRGAKVPVINLSTLLNEHGTQAVMRYVTVRLGQRQAAIAVNSVDGVAHFSAESLDTLSPLLDLADNSMVAAIGTLDASLFLVLDASRIIPDAAWQVLDVYREQT